MTALRIGYDARHAGRGLGISTFVVSLARELVALGDVELVWLGDPASAPTGVHCAVRADRPPYPLLDGPLGRALARRLAIDVVHFTGNTGWRRSGPVASVLTLQDLIFLARARRGVSPRQIAGHAYERWLIGRALATADVVAVSSRAVASQVGDRFGPEVEPRIVAYGVDLPPAGPPLATAAPPSAPDGAPYLLAFAGLDPRKRTAEVIAAWRALGGPGGSAAEPPLTIGLHLLASAGLAPELRAQLAPDLAAGRVRILDHVSREQVASELAGALALAYPSTDEGFGLPVLEGMAAGTPVLSGLAPATREVGGEAIIALDAGDIAGSIAAAVRRLAADPALARSTADAGREHAARFSWRATATAYVDLYRLAIERHVCGS